METAHEATASIALVERALPDVLEHAADAYPAECCGVIHDDGAARRTNVQDALHAEDRAAFPRDASRAFRMPADEQLALARSMDGPRPARVLYHSHVDAGAYFSDADVAGATLGGRPLYPALLHLVVSVRGGVPHDAALFALDGGGAREIARFGSRSSRTAGNPGPSAPPGR